MDSGETDSAVLGVLEDEEDKDRRYGNSGIESGGEDVVILGPPREGAAADDVVEGESNDCGGDVVDSGGWGDVTGTSEHDGQVDVLVPRVGVAAGEGVWDSWADGTDEEEPQERVVHLARAEHVFGGNNTPDDGGGTEHGGRQANESVILVARAHIFDVGEHPRLDTELSGQSDDGGNNLSPEHGTWGDLHVVTKLEVRSEGKTLSHGDISPSLEHHHGDGATGKGVTNDELSNDVKTDLLIGDGLDHADGDDVDEGDQERNDEGPDGEL